MESDLFTLESAVATEASELLRKAKQSDLGWKVLSAQEIVKLLSVLDLSLRLREQQLKTA